MFLPARPLHFVDAEGFADHQSSGKGEHQGQWMQIPEPDGPYTPVEVLAEPILPGGQGEDAGQQRGGRNGSPFKIGDLVPARREALGGYIISGQSAHPTADEVRQRDPVPPSLQAGGESEGGRSDSEGNDVGQRIQFTSEHRRLMPPSSDPAIEPVEKQRRRREGCGGEEMSRQPTAHVVHGEENGREPAGGIGEGEDIGQMKLAEHREMFRRCSGHGGKPTRGFNECEES